LEPDGGAANTANEPTMSDLGLHVMFSYELADALEKLMQEQDKCNLKADLTEP
jgi:hypothetical protein